VVVDDGTVESGMDYPYTHAGDSQEKGHCNDCHSEEERIDAVDRYEILPEFECVAVLSPPL